MTKLNIEILREPAEVLLDYAQQLSIRFLVRSELMIVLPKNGLGGMQFIETQVDQPYWIDHDEGEESGPERWLKQWDLKNWCVVSACHQNERIGGAVVAYDTPGVNTLMNRKDVAALWDLRVNPVYRGKGIGTKLFREALCWAKERHCNLFRIETQTNNVPACRFYSKMGAKLGGVDRFAYEDKPGVTRLDWYIEL